MSDINVMAAIIQKHTVAHVRGRFDTAARSYPCTDSSVSLAAKAPHEAGFRMVDDKSAAKLAELETRLARIEGYMVVR